MTTTEKLERIKAKCQQLLASDFRPDTSLPGGLPSVTHALSKSTIAAIDAIHKMQDYYIGFCANDGCGCARDKIIESLSESILSAWPEELL